MGRFFGFKIIIALVVVVAAASCGKPAAPGEDLTVARQAIDSGDYQAAYTTLEEIFASADSIDSPTMLSQMAVMYMIVNEHIPDSNSDLKAIDCFRRAVKFSPDSVAAVFASLPPEEAQYLFMLKMLTGSIDNASSITVDDYEAADFADESYWAADDFDTNPDSSL